MPFVPDSREPSVSVEEHVQRILEGVEPLPPYEQPLLEALGLPVCEQVVAPLDLPVFDNSAMDGYAVVHADVEHASESEPVHLPVVGEAAAGQTKLFAMSPGTAVKIMTGAPVPQGADAIKAEALTFRPPGQSFPTRWCADRHRGPREMLFDNPWNARAACGDQPKNAFIDPASERTRERAAPRPVAKSPERRAEGASRQPAPAARHAPRQPGR